MAPGDVSIGGLIYNPLAEHTTCCCINGIQSDGGRGRKCSVPPASHRFPAAPSSLVEAILLTLGCPQCSGDRKNMRLSDKRTKRRARKLIIFGTQMVASDGVVVRAFDYEPGDPGSIPSRTRSMSEHAPRRCVLGKGTLHDFPHSTQV
ncbi:hypothetical protein Bbelb_073510 [Branchiostoma belcheri]|nr:hypothetical protein Bbelb_073510 [Branchiostoma belcheri]